MSRTLDQIARELPTEPGVYLFKDADGVVLYVGKAANLRARVRQYLSGTDERHMVPFLVHNAHDVEVVRTRTDKEALILENTLIKQHRPKYNTKLRDDKNFLHLRLSRRRKWPRYQLVRQIRDDGARYFGPFHSATHARRTLAVVQRHFPLRTCTDAVLNSRTRACLLHQMGRCVAPCVGKVDKAEYDALIDRSFLFLEGRSDELVRDLEARMMEAAEDLRFEEAARLRDQIGSIRATTERQHVVDTKLGNRDVWGLFREGDAGVVAVVPVREGMMGEPATSHFEGRAESDGELLSSVINSHYADGGDLPREVLVPCLPPDAETLVEVLSERRGGKVLLHQPQRGDKARLVELAAENARSRFTAANDEDSRRSAALESIAVALDLAEPPWRMECFDNSNFQGDNPVAAMAVFSGGRPDRPRYRRYRIKTVVGADDFASMREIILRRMRRAQAEDDAPDLLVIDGGRGQLNAALDALAELGITDQPIVGISKPRTERRRGERNAQDKLILPDREEPVVLPEHHPGLRMLQYLRDQTHDTAIRYHRDRRRKSSLASVLEALPGVGPTRRTRLLRVLGSARAVAEADVETLMTVPGIGRAVAEQIHAAFRPDSQDV